MGTAMMWAWVNPVLRPTEHRTQGLNASIEYEFSVFFRAKQVLNLLFVALCGASNVFMARGEQSGTTKF